MYLPVVYPTLITTMGLSYAQVGFVTLVAGAGATLVQPVFGYASDRGANEEIAELARTAIGRIDRGQRAADPVYQHAVAEQQERDIFDFSYFASVGYGNDSNVFRSPSEPYIDFADPDLPLIEGTTVGTRHGPVKTDHILFVAAGAFHGTSPTDLVPELQGRFPIRVELASLTREDLLRILTEPTNSLVRQYTALLANGKENPAGEAPTDEWLLSLFNFDVQGVEILE